MTAAQESCRASVQNALDALAANLGIPCVRICRVEDEAILTDMTSRSKGNPYSAGQTEPRNSPTSPGAAALRAAADPDDAASSRISESEGFLALPVIGPDDALFGLLCAEAPPERRFSPEEKGLMLAVRDLAAAQLSALRSRALVDAVLEASPDGILVVDRDLRVSLASRQFCGTWGIPRENPEGKDFLYLLSNLVEQAHAPEIIRAEARRLLDRPEERDEGTEIMLADGRTLESRSAGVRDSDRNPWGRLWIYRDVTERKRLECEVREFAALDCLTGLPNRRSFLEAGGQEVQRALRTGLPLSLLLISVDGHSETIEKEGEENADTVIREIAETGLRVLRDMDALYRYGGELFAVLLPGTDLRGAVICGDRLRAAVGRSQVCVDGRELGCTVSIGAAELEPPMDINALLRHADDALYTAVHRGRNRVEAYRH